MGCPVNVPYHQRRGEPALSQISTPTMDQVPPLPFVHEIAVVAGPLAEPAEAAPNVLPARLVPPVVYPVPVNSVPAVVPVGAVVVRRTFAGVVNRVGADVPRVVLRIRFACA